MATNNTEETVTVNLRQDGATRTIRAITGLTEAIQQTEASAESLEASLDTVFNLASLDAYEARVTAIARELRSVGNIDMLGDSTRLESILSEIELSTQHSANNTAEMSGHTSAMAHDMSILRQNSDMVNDDLQESAQHAGTTADEVRRTRIETERMNRAADADRVRRQRGAEGAAGLSSSRNQGRNMSSMLSNAGALAAGYAVVAANIYAVTTAFRLLSEYAADARLMEISKTLSAAKGVSVEVAAASMRDTLDNAISVQESMKLAAASVSKGFTTDQLEKLTLVARRASVALGLDLTDAMNRVTKGIAKQEVELLDELGITIKLTEAFDKYALQHKLVADDLTSFQRQQALTNLVVEKGAETLGSIDDVMAATEWEKFSANASTALSKIGQDITETGSRLSNLVGAINNAFASVTLASPLAEILGLKEVAEIANEGTDALAIMQANLAVMQATSVSSLTEGLVAGQEKLKKIDKERWAIQAKANAENEKAKELGYYVTGNENSTAGPNLGNATDSVLRTAQLVALDKKREKVLKNIAISEQEIANTRGSSTFIPGNDGDVQPIASKIFGTDDPKIAAEMVQQFLRLKSAAVATNDAMNAAGKGVGVSATKNLDTIVREGAAVIKQLNTTSDLVDKFGKKIGSISNAQLKAISNSGLSDSNSKDLGIQQAIVEETVAAAVSLRKAKEQIGVVNRENAKARVSPNSGTELEAARKLLSAQQDKLAARIRFQKEGSKGSKETKAQLLVLLALEQKVQKELESRASTKKSNADFARLNIIEAKSSLTIARENLTALREHSLTLSSINASETTRKANTRKIVTAELAVADALEAQKVQQVAISLFNSENEYSYKSALKLAQERLDILKDEDVRLQGITHSNDERLSSSQKIVVAEAAVTDALENQRVKLLELSAARSQSSIDVGVASGSITSEQAAIKELKILQDKKSEALNMYNKDSSTDNLGALDKANTDVALKQIGIRDAAALKSQEAQTKANGVLGGSLQSMSAIPNQDAEGKDLEGNQQDQKDILMASNTAQASEAMAGLIGQTPGLDAMATGLTNLSTAAATTGMSMEKGASMAISGLQAMGGMLANVSQGAISEIDQQIAMEKKRDGSSEKSLAKIKQLEAKKIKMQQEAAVQSIVISTAVAVMNAAANPWPIPAIPMMAAAAVAGGMALSQAKSKGSNQLAQLNAKPEGSTTSSVQVGERDNNINVSNLASEGERAYVTGARGEGSANDFTPRATGGKSRANTNYMFGEFGPEVVSLPQDASVTSNEDMRNSSTDTSTSGGANNYNITIQTMDSQSFLDNSGNIFEAFSHEASQQGMRVDKLRN